MIDTRFGAGCYPTLSLISITVLTGKVCYQSHWDTCFGAGCYPTLSLDSISFLELELCINCLLIKRECL